VVYDDSRLSSRYSTQSSKVSLFHRDIHSLKIFVQSRLIPGTKPSRKHNGYGSPNIHVLAGPTRSRRSLARCPSLASRQCFELEPTSAWGMEHAWISWHPAYPSMYMCMRPRSSVFPAASEQKVEAAYGSLRLEVEGGGHLPTAKPRAFG
jgi:hypothetical protein